MDFRTLGLSHTDLLRSCDALIGKPGYGTFVEAACNQTPVLYLPREDWPEQPYLVEWLERRVPLVAVTATALRRGELKDALRAVWSQQPARPWQRSLTALPAGEQEIANRLAKWLS